MQTPAELNLPFTEWRPGQRLALRTILTAKTRHVVINAPTGCVAGSTELRLNRASNSQRRTIEEEHRLQGNRRRQDIPTYTRALKGTHIGLHKIQHVAFSGVKPVYTLVTDGPSLTATACHLIWTGDEYVPLGDLQHGGMVIGQDDRPRAWKKHPKDSYRMIQGMRHHPFASRFFSTRTAKRCLKPEGVLYRVPTHRVAVEAELNGLTVARFVEICRYEPLVAIALKFLDPVLWAVHHKDEDSFNNALDNLQVMTHDEHKALHGDHLHFQDAETREWKVQKVVHLGQQETFDVVCEEPYRNFLANGIVVHNSGKSLIAAALPGLSPEVRQVVLTATKALQDAYGIFELVDLRGASNYRCRAAVDEFSSWFPINRRKYIQCDDGPCHVGHSCSLKDQGCDYFDAKRNFVAANSGSTNYASWLTNRRLAGGLGAVGRLVCDEAHALPEQLMAAHRIDVPLSMVDNHFAPRGYKGWQRWALEKLDTLKTDDQPETVKRETLERSLKLMAAMDHTWAWDQDERGWHFEPTIPAKLMPLLHTFSEDQPSMVVYLSATITPSLLDMLDVAAEDVTFHTMKSSFPVAHRPIYFVPGVRADYKSMNYPHIRQRFIEAIDDIAAPRDDRRGLIHCVSFDRGAFIAAASSQQSRMILHAKGESVAHAIGRFDQAPDNAVLVSPSIMTGHDFKYRRAEFNILPKLPFPQSQSNIMRARMRATPRYGDHYTMQHLIQACGRPVRAEDDRAETFVTDEHVAWWYRQNRDLAPDWFDEAIVKTRRLIIPPSRLT